MNPNPNTRVEKQVPEGFKETALGMRTAEAAELYGVCVAVARRWFHESGITPARIRKGKIHEKQSEKYRKNVINVCLSCKFPECIGICENYMRATKNNDDMSRASI